MKKIIMSLFLVCAIGIAASAQTTKPKTTTTSKTTMKTDAKTQTPATEQKKTVMVKHKRKHHAMKPKTKTSSK